MVLVVHSPQLDPQSMMMMMLLVVAVVVIVGSTWPLPLFGISPVVMVVVMMMMMMTRPE